MHGEQVMLRWQRSHILATNEAPPYYKPPQLRAVRFPVVTLTLSVSLGFGDQKSVCYFHFLILTWQNLWNTWDKGGEQPALEATSQVLNQIREKDDKRQTLWRQDGVFIMTIVLPSTIGSAAEPPPLAPGEGHSHTWGFSSLLMGQNSLNCPDVRGSWEEDKTHQRPPEVSQAHSWGLSAKDWKLPWGEVPPSWAYFNPLLFLSGSFSPPHDGSRLWPSLQPTDIKIAIIKSCHWTRGWWGLSTLILSFFFFSFYIYS